MPIITASAPQERTTQESLVGEWIDFIRAMEDHYAVTVRQTEAEVRAAADLAAAFGVHPPASLPSQQELVIPAR